MRHSIPYCFCKLWFVRREKHFFFVLKRAGGYLQSSYLKASANTSACVPAITSLWSKSCGSIWTSSLFKFYCGFRVHGDSMCVLLEFVFGQFFFRSFKTLLPISFDWYTFTAFWAVSPVIKCCRCSYPANGFRDSNKLSILIVSALSFVCLDGERSLCYSLVSQFTPVNIIAVLISDVVGLERTHTKCCVSDIPLLCVSPPVVFILCMRTCSITRSEESPAQYSFDLRTTCRTSSVNLL